MLPKTLTGPHRSVSEQIKQVQHEKPRESLPLIDEEYSRGLPF